jgi:hypothetical protein
MCVVWVGGVSVANVTTSINNNNYNKIGGGVAERWEMTQNSEMPKCSSKEAYRKAASSLHW